MSAAVESVRAPRAPASVSGRSQTVRRERRRPPASLLVMLAGLACWVVGIARLSPGTVGEWGPLDAGLDSVLIAAGLGILLAAFLLELARGARSWVLAVELIGVIVGIHAVVPTIYGAPEYSWVYKHVGVASALQQNGRITLPNDIYQQWPALFAAVASLSSLAHTNPIVFAEWAPLFFELADALLLAGIFMMLSASRRLPWLAMILYEGLIAWVGQDYLSPQAFAYLLWLGVIFVVLRWLRADPAPARGVVGRLRGWLTTAMDPAPATTSVQRRCAFVVVIVLFFVITAAHQLTPYMALASILLLTILDLVRPRWLLVVMALVAGGYLALHYHLISQQFGLLSGGGDPVANAKGYGSAGASYSARVAARIVDLLAIIMWVGGAAVVVRRVKWLGSVAIPGALALAPFLILFGQSYGQEAIYRVFLFSAPWCSLLLASGLWQPGGRSRGWMRVRWVFTAVLCAAVVFGGAQGLWAPTAANAFTPGDVDASYWLYTHIPRGSLVVLPVEEFPVLETSHYDSYELQVMPSDAQVGETWLNEADASEVRSWLSSLGHRTAYVVVSRSMTAYASYYGAPRGFDRLLTELPTRLHGTPVYRARGTTIYRLSVVIGGRR